MLSSLIILVLPALSMAEFCSPNGNCFIFSEVKASNVWDAAEYCSKKNAILAEVGNESARLEMIEAVQPLLRAIRKQEPYVFLGMNDIFQEGRWVLQDGTEVDPGAISGQLNDTDRDCSAIMTNTYTVINVPCTLPRTHRKLHFLCQVKEDIGCYNEAPDYLGFNKVSTTNGRSYGSVVTYSCSGIHRYSRCFGSLGWDVRDLVKQQCKESRVEPKETTLCNYDKRDSIGRMVERVYRMNAVEAAQQVSMDCYTDRADIQARFEASQGAPAPFPLVCCFITLYGNSISPEKQECPDGFQRIANKCFLLFKERVTNAWDAADICYTKGALLAEIPDRATHEGITEYLRKESMNGEIAIFLGMNDIREEGRWELYNGSVLPLPGEGVYTPLSHKVDNWLDAEDCSSIQPTEGYLINDIPCTIQRGIDDWPTFYPADLPFLCEIRGTTKCSGPPPNIVSGYRLERFNDNLEYGSSAAYRCSEQRSESQCYGTLGWDIRGLGELRCDEAEQAECPDGFENISNKCFRVFRERVTNAWDAADLCYTRGAVLAEIPDLVTHDGITDYLRRENMNGEIAIFLGMNDLKEEGRWELYNGSVLPLPGEGVYTPLSHKVDNWLDAEDCSSIQPTEGYLINDIPCTIQRGIDDWPTFYPADLPVLCEIKGTTKCSVPPASDISGYKLEQFNESLEYGSLASYSCSEKSSTSRCYATLGWDLRELNQVDCEEESVCNKWQKPCDDGNCVHYSKMCNGEKDCLDGSDESPGLCANHKSNCSYYEFPCFDGSCVFETDACNNKMDCPDGSDEDPVFCENCGGAKFLCPDGKCISRINMCDSMNDCSDGADEDEATCAKERCTPLDYFGCKSGPCILGSQVCDGIEDCWDGEDEKLRKCRYICKEDEFKCGTWGICISGDLTCDGEDDCFDGGSDEDPAFCEDCGFRYKCSNGRCIRRSYLCDGLNHCEHDEIPNICKGEQLCGKGQFRCDNEICISANLMCNKEDDCGDNSDEPESCNVVRPSYTELMEEAERIRNG